MNCVYTEKLKKQKMAFTGHVLRESSSEDALLILKGKWKQLQYKEDQDECGWVTSSSGHS